METKVSGFMINPVSIHSIFDNGIEFQVKVAAQKWDII